MKTIYITLLHDIKAKKVVCESYYIKHGILSMLGVSDDTFTHGSSGIAYLTDRKILYVAVDKTSDISFS